MQRATRRRRRRPARRRRRAALQRCRAAPPRASRSSRSHRSPACSCRRAPALAEAPRRARSPPPRRRPPRRSGTPAWRSPQHAPLAVGPRQGALSGLPQRSSSTASQPGGERPTGRAPLFDSFTHHPPGWCPPWGALVGTPHRVGRRGTHSIRRRRRGWLPSQRRWGPAHPRDRRCDTRRDRLTTSRPRRRAQPTCAIASPRLGARSTSHRRPDGAVHGRLRPDLVVSSRSRGPFERHASFRGSARPRSPRRRTLRPGRSR